MSDPTRTSPNATETQPKRYHRRNGNATLTQRKRTALIPLYLQQHPKSPQIPPQTLPLPPPKTPPIFFAENGGTTGPPTVGGARPPRQSGRQGDRGRKSPLELAEPGGISQRRKDLWPLECWRQAALCRGSATRGHGQPCAGDNRWGRRGGRGTIRLTHSIQWSYMVPVA